MIADSRRKSPVLATSGGQHRMRRIGQISILVTGPDDLRDDEWQEFAGITIQLGREYGHPIGSIVYTPTQVPNSSQRAYLQARSAEMQAEGLTRVAFCTDSALVRGGVTALSWIMRATAAPKMFACRDTGAAAQWVTHGTRYDTAVIHDALTELIVESGYRVQR